MPYRCPTIGYWDTKGYTLCAECAQKVPSDSLLEPIDAGNAAAQDEVCDQCDADIGASYNPANRSEHYP